MDKNFNPRKREHGIFEKWEKNSAFRAGANAKPNAESYCIMIPPPNVTGSLHMGHAFNNTIQDILVRWHRMRGFDTLWQPGQDHAGIATQMVVERKLADNSEPSREELGREAFLRKVWEWKEQSGDTIVNQLKRLGASCDWDRNRFTMDPGFHSVVLRAFVQLYDMGCIYKGKRLVNWDPMLETAISDLEVEQVQEKGKLWRFRYKLSEGRTYDFPIDFDESGKPTKFEKRDYVVVATTRPETMLGDSGVAVNPNDARYRAIIGAELELPLVNRLIPIVADEHADPKKGTGAVKITPAHDFNDWEVGKRHNLEVINIFDRKAKIEIKGNDIFLNGCQPNDFVFSLHGLDRYEARKKIVAAAEGGMWLDGIDDEIHAVPYGDRSNVPIEPLLTNQWFVDTKKIVGPALDAVQTGRTKILPEQYSKIYFNWLENIEPWCVSRQLWWGHQIPVWYDEDGNEYCAETEKRAREMAGGKPIYRDPDVLDTWFSSALWPIGTLGWPDRTPELSRYYPTSVLVTGFDIIFFWVARMMMMQLALIKEAPFHTVYVHALVRDERGKKMSKSKGNVLDPIDLIDEFGADAVRFTLTAMAVMGRDLRLSTNRVAGYRNFGTKLWNAARYAELNNCGFEESYKPELVKITVNRWIVGETARFKEAFDSALHSYRFNDAAQLAYNHIWKKFCDWYVEFSKPLLNGKDLDAKSETKQTMSWALDQCLILLHPIMPFITEELWANAPKRKNMLIHQDWPEYTSKNLENKAADKEIGWIIDLIEQIRSLRVDLGVKASAKIVLYKVDLDKTYDSLLAQNSELVKSLARLSAIKVTKSFIKGSVFITVEGGEFALKVAEFLDINQEKQRLNKAISKIKAEESLLKGKLSNQKFLSNAPAHLIEESKRRITELSEEKIKLNVGLKRLAELD
ncbi:MAG: valine--tRNA ligase [Pseudomonadota bacterium]|nr:valine--tRNA ligase [Pseudomonadota bacterium]